MGLHDLLTKTVGHTVTRTDGIGETVLYTFKSGGTPKTPVQAIVERDVEEDALDKEKKRFTLFHALVLSQAPSEGDTLEFEGELWMYHRTRDQIGSTYDVIAYIKRHTIGRGRGR